MKSFHNDRPHRRRPSIRVLGALLGLVMLGGLLAGCSTDEDVTAESVTYQYIIPRGTGDRIDAGEPVNIVPRRLDLNLGDSIEIVNQDAVGHNVGPFFVGEGETVSQVFRTEATYEDACSIHPSGAFTIVVSSPVT